MNKLKPLLALLAATFFGLIIAGCSSFAPSDASKTKEEKPTDSKAVKQGSRLGELAPDFELTTMTGKKISLKSLKGSPSVLVFWSAYCVDCEEEAPHINKLAEDFKSAGLKVLGINIGESVARTLGGIKDFGIKYDVARDEGRKVTRKYKVIGTPTVIFLDEKGIVKYNGNELPKDYAKRLNDLIS